MSDGDYDRIYDHTQPCRQVDNASQAIWRLESMLRELEWSSEGPSVQGYGVTKCPICGASGAWGYDAGEPWVRKEKYRPKHVDGCRLAALLQADTAKTPTCP